MDKDGNIKGFAKVTSKPAVRKLISHEAATLGKLQTLNLKTTYVPKAPIFGNLGDTRLSNV